jgi:hypothetical protein
MCGDVRCRDPQQPPRVAQERPNLATGTTAPVRFRRCGHRDHSPWIVSHSSRARTRPGATVRANAHAGGSLQPGLPSPTMKL